MRWAIVLTVCGCNQVFGLHKTGQPDAAYYDAPIDAPFACPPIGTAPRFSSQLHQLGIRAVTDYTISTSGRSAVGMPNQVLSAPVVEGPIDGAMDIAVPVEVNFGLSRPRLSPEGDELFVSAYDELSLGTVVRDYTGSHRAWSRGPDLVISPTTARLSVPTRGPNRRLLVPIGGDLHELVETAPNTWTDVRTHSARDELGEPSVDAPYLSPDGLRMLAMGAEPSMIYADRSSVDMAFSSPAALDGVPATLDAFMTEDCSRIYFSGLDALFYVQQM